MGKKFLTLDIGAANIALAEYESSGKGDVTLVNYGVAPLAASLDTGDAGTILSPALMSLAHDKGIRPGDVAVSISGQLVFPRFASLPPGDDSRFEQLVRYEIEQNVPFPIDEMVYDHQVLGDTEAGDKSVMIVAAKVDQIETITNAVTSAGFRPMMVDVSPIAVTNALKKVRGEDSSCVLLLDIGAKTTSLVIVDGDRVYNRSIPIAGNNITRDISQALGCSTEEAESVKREKAYVALGGVVEDPDEVSDRISKVCRSVFTRLHAEISRSVNFYRSQQGGSAPVKLYLTGGTTLLPQIDRYFSENLQVEVEYFNPYEAVGVSSSLDTGALEADAPLLASTTGLALHCAGLARFAIDLLPPSIISERSERAKIPFVAAAGVLLSAALVMFYLASQRDADVIMAQKDAVSAKVSALKSSEQKLKAATTAADAACADAESLRSLLASRSTALSRLNVLRSALGAGMWIVKWDGSKAVVRGWKDRIAALVDEDAKRHGGKKRPESEIVVEKLKINPAVDPAGVNISAISDLGKTGEIREFTVELKFK